MQNGGDLVKFSLLQNYFNEAFLFIRVYFECEKMKKKKTKAINNV